MFYADLHVHSKFSRATSRDCDLEHLALWAGKKGIGVVATGDFTHPGWFAEIEEKLIPAEPGLFRLRPDLEREVWRRQERPAPAGVRFILEVEISTIYKRDGRTRKVHHLVYVPGLDHARRLTESLSRIGNLKSDGRPILGLDSRDLLEIALQSGEGSYLVPAHVWTPWFSVLGSKSGFESIEECYGDLAAEVFALETGLSSDPPMNWRVSRLDRYALVSNSDAHSPPKLGREACVFDTEVDYFAMRRALQTGQGYGGTVEFFPEEGKYHLDGHRKCGVCLSPEETRRHGGNCPQCGKPVTLGVMYRVGELADRARAPEPLPPRAAPFRSLVPLEEVLGEVCGVGPQSNTVQQKYEEILSRLGPELFILEHAPPEDVARAGSPLLAEAILRMRQGRVIRQGGYDGEYGTIRLFTKDELRRGTAVGLLFDMPEEVETPGTDLSQPPLAAKAHGLQPVGFGECEHDRSRSQADEIPVSDRQECVSSDRQECLFSSGILGQLDPEQRIAAEAIRGPVLIVAGPGTGKTRTLTHRIAHLIADHGVPPEQCLTLTFSRRAAGEMIERLGRLLPTAADRVPVMTFHALGLAMLREHGGRLGLSSSLRVASESERSQLLVESLSVSQRKAGQLLARISRNKRRLEMSEQTEAADDARAFEVYERELRARGWVDFDDLIALPLGLLKGNPDLVDHYRSRYPWVSVDEYQDIDAAQYRLIKLLVPADGNLCVIGDPDQAIYGFRGAEVGHFQRFCEDFPAARTIALERNYRSTQTIVDAALQLIAPSSLVADRHLEAHGLGPEQIEIHACTTDRAEAEFVVHSIERLIGGSTFFSLDSRRVATDEGESLSFADFAVLYRTEAQADALAEALERSGMPFQRRSHKPLADEPSVQAAIRAMGEGPDGGPAQTSVLARLDRAARSVGEKDRQLGMVLPVLRPLALRCGNDLSQFLSELALGMEVDLWDPRADRVSLLTLHAAKGLEFPVVLIVGCEDGILPLSFGPRGEMGNTAEERRLFFVGMTRARERLILSHARKRLWRGKVRASSPSPFLSDVESGLLAHHQHRAVKKSAILDQQRTLFDG
jgi:DNA helicase-2/ATP-dependent DNA helicase PcrA